MTKEQVLEIFEHKAFPYEAGRDQLIETHISWVILAGQYAYKIKKPIRYSFLDFSSPDRRRFFCHRELMLNQRLTTGVYLRVLPIDGEGIKSVPVSSPIDYALLMRRLDGKRQMNVLLQKNAVTGEHIRQLASKIASFHKASTPVAGAELAPELFEKFSDLLSVQDTIGRELGPNAAQLVQDAVEAIRHYLEDHETYLLRRSQNGWIVDGHGDLHSRNIMLLDDPVIFDCIEFNDAFRHLDVLNEIAFFCMDLEAYGHEHLANTFLVDYLNRHPAINSTQDQDLFLYYKLYRANVRLKVNCLRVAQPDNALQLVQARQAITTYYGLFHRYFEKLQKQSLVRENY